VGSEANNISQTQILGVRPPPMRSAAKFLRLSHLRRLKECEKVAAVCYRIRPGGIQFLLVQTRGGRWTFPKGSVEPGLTHAQSAALEAFEEAGVHGRMEEASFTRYVHHKQRSSSVAEIMVSAHLCEVSRLEPAPEPGRNRTWFSAEKANQRLREDRMPDYGAELARVVDRAVARIQRLQQPYERPQPNAISKVTVIDGFSSCTRTPAPTKRRGARL
jgi:8-oxo-dGTP pyrophosphatase MutT (NUDIX family)